MSGDGESSSPSVGDVAQKKEQDTLKQAQEAVEQLYRFSTRYFEDRDVECAERKESDVRDKMQHTVAILDSLKEVLPREQFAYLKGKALNVLPAHSPEAEVLLTNAVKRDPSLAGAWVSLGENYWKNGKVEQAHDCFSSSITHVKTKEALRSLSMVLRQMGTTQTQREEKVRESVERAKEAVAEDVKDGVSWMILGNAYLSLFFMTSSDPKLLKQSKSAYHQAERDSGAANNPDLHYNRATLCLYEEDYKMSLDGFARAAALDPGWSMPGDKMADTKHFLQAMTHSVSSKGRMKSKKAAAMHSSLSSPDKFVGSLSETKTIASVADLKEGENSGLVFVGGVSAIVPTTNRVPYACSLVDGAGSSVGLTLYGLAVSTNLSTGDILTIPDPHFKCVDIDSDKIKYGNIRCIDPHRILLNGEKLSPDKLAHSVLKITTFN